MNNFSPDSIRNKSLFLYAMLLASCLPFFIGMALMPFSINHERQLLWWLLLLITPLGAHQTTTMYFYFDQTAWPMVRENIVTYLLNPALIILSCFSLMYLFGQQLLPYLTVLLSAWTIYHYQKQNVGIFALISPLINQTKMTLLEKRLIILSGVSGMMAFGSPTGAPLFEGTWFAFLGPASYRGSLLLLLGILGVFAVLCWQQWRAVNVVGRPKMLLRCAILFLFLVFYTPLYFIDNKLLAFGMFAAAHGLQYFFVMFFVASDGNLLGTEKLFGAHKPLLKIVVSTVFLALLTWLLWSFWTMTQIKSHQLSGQPLGYGFLGLATSFSFVHYYLDGKFWRMSNPKIRQLVQEKLDFIFK